MRVKVKSVPKMIKGGPIGNINNPIPYPSLFNINPFGLIATNPVGTNDESVTSIIKPVPREDANVEAEKGELLVKHDLTGLYKIHGKTHAEGGTPIIAKGGSFIFSNDKGLAFTKEDKDTFNFKGGSNTKRNNTPAKVLQREVNAKDYNSLMSILSDNKKDTIAKQSAALMLQKHQEKIGQVALLQEAKKSMREGIPSFAMGPTQLSTPQFDHAKQGADLMYAALGGFIPQYAEGGDTEDPDNPPDKTGKWAYDNRKSKNPKTGVVSNDWNAMKNYNSPQDYASAVGYTGKVDGSPTSNTKLQQYVMQKYPDIVKQFHSPTQYGMPASGRPDDGKLGVRWDAIGQEIQRRNSPPGATLPPLASLNIAPPNVTAAPPSVKSPLGPPAIEDQWKGFKFGMNPQEQLSAAAPFLSAIAQKPFYDMLVQKYTPNVRMDRIDPTQEVADVQAASSLGTREAYQNMPGQAAAAQGAAAQARATGAIQNIYHQTDERNSQIANQELGINEQNKVGDTNFNLGQIQQTYRNNILTQQRRQEQLTNAGTASLNNGLAIQNHLDAMGFAATQSALPFVTQAKDAQGNPLYTTDAQGRKHIQDGVPIGFDQNRNTTYNPMFGGLNSVGVNQAGANAIGRNFNSILMEQINTALQDKSPEGTKRLYTLMLGLDRTNKPNAKGDTPLENIGQGYSRAAYGY